MTLVDRSHLVTQAEALARFAAEQAAEAEQQGRLTPDVVEAIRSSRLPGMGLPEALGGFASPPVAIADVLERIALGDAACAWVVMVASTASLTAAYLEPEAARRVWSEGAETLTAGVLAPKGVATPTADGYRVTGWWPFASGSLHASWISGGVFIDGDDDRVVHAAFFPASEVAIVDSWHVVGLRATGSHDFRVDDVEVPADLVTTFTRQPWPDEPLYRFPVYGMLAMGVAAVCLGIGQAAIGDLVTLATDKVPTGSKRSLAQRPLVQEEVARATTRLAAARDHLHTVAVELWERASQGEDLSAGERARLRGACTHAAETSAEAVTAMFRAGGGTSIYETSPLERRLRDVNAAVQHMMVARPTWEVTGRALLGVDAHGEL